MKKIVVINLILIIILIYFILQILSFNDVIGITQNNLESNARKLLNIESDWLVEKDINNLIGVLVFYPVDFRKYIIAIYVNKKGLSLGYQYKQSTGGNMDDMPISYSYSSSEIEYSIVVEKGEIEDDIYTNYLNTESLFKFITPEDIGEEKVYVEKIGEVEIYYRER